MCGAAHSSHIHATSLGNSIHCRFRSATHRVSPFHSIPVCGLRDRSTLRSCHGNRIAEPHHPSPFAPTGELPLPLHLRPGRPSVIHSPATRAPRGFPLPPPSAFLFNALMLPPSSIRSNPPSQSSQLPCTRPHNGVPLTPNSPPLSFPSSSDIRPNASLHHSDSRKIVLVLPAPLTRLRSSAPREGCKRAGWPHGRLG
jgi:hypothetical protein